METPSRKIYQSVYKHLEKFNDWETKVPRASLGYETKMQVHDPSQPFCPFDHCNLSLSYMSPYKQKQTQDLCAEVLSRKLFTSDKTVNVLNEPRNKSPQVKQSPSKEELKLENKLLHQKVKVLETKRGLGNSSCDEIFEREKLQRF